MQSYAVIFPLGAQIEAHYICCSKPCIFSFNRVLKYLKQSILKDCIYQYCFELVSFKLVLFICYYKNILVLFYICKVLEVEFVSQIICTFLILINIDSICQIVKLPSVEDGLTWIYISNIEERLFPQTLANTGYDQMSWILSYDSLKIQYCYIFISFFAIFFISFVSFPFFYYEWEGEFFMFKSH